ncbi:hypothetical protein AX16_001418 [Volvariella volvacea WC 439]|nr:hypothetical protein AX16_001418 [Volvariella volvacea WC 439]
MPTGTQPTTDHDTPAESGKTQRHYSIDLSLELERQLNMDSQPPTPSYDVENQGDKNVASLDPQVLQHLVTQLQHSLSDITKERDQLRQMLVDAESKEAGMKETIQQTDDKVKSLEGELAEARNKIKDDEDSIAMLRTKVEESRRGLMRLQTESRRNSAVPAPLDLSRAGIASFSSPPSSKRASFTPLTGSTLATRPTGQGHRRISSVTDTNGDAFTSHPPSSARRISGLFGLGLTGPGDMLDPQVLENEGLKKEVEKLKEELEQTRHELNEANEAKDASESCVKVLREFIAENNVGAAGNPLPPQAQTSSSEKTGAGGWGFKLWKTPEAITKSPSPSFASLHTTQTSPPQAPLSKKIGGFFSSRTASVSSIGSPPLPQSHNISSTGTSPDHQRDSLYSSSDTSSVAEPVSPAGDANGSIIVRDVASISDITSELPKGDLSGEPRRNVTGVLTS